METLLWTLQGLLATVFLLTGLTKLTQPRLKMAAGPMGWAAGATDQQFRTVGLLEVLGAAGVVLPAALNIAPVLTPIAALGLAAMMIGAGVTHLRLHETGRVLAPVALFFLALLVAFLRLTPHTF